MDADVLRQRMHRRHLWFLTSFVGAAVGLLLGKHVYAQTDQVPEAVSNVAAVSLVIHGGGGMTDSCRKAFAALAGGPAARLVVIPTATGDAFIPSLEDVKTQWCESGITNITLIHTRDRMQANEPEFFRPITEATAIWFSGGDQQRLADAYVGTKVEVALRAAMERGAVIGGTSAGAAIQSSVMIARGRDEPELTTGLDLLPNSIVDQHFLKRSRMNRLMEAVRRNPGRTGVGIDEKTSLIVHDGIARVTGISFVVTIRLVDGKLDIRSHPPGTEFRISDFDLIGRAVEPNVD